MFFLKTLCLLIGLKTTVNAVLFPFREDRLIIYDTILPNEWSSVKDCPVRYVDFVYPSDAAPVSGRPAFEREFAHMAAIGWTQNKTGNIEWNCGGSLISERFILTAGHCTSFRGVAPDVVRLGDLDLESDDDNENAQQFSIAEIIRHPDYKGKFRYHDLALLKLNDSVTLHDTVCPACIWNNQTIKFKTVEACGYGQIGQFEEKTPKLLTVTLSPIPTDACKEFYPPDRKLTDGLSDQQFCAVDLEGQQDTCLGDSGGPLQIKLLGKGRQNPFLIGVTSFGRGCGTNSPGVYVKLSEYIDWLESVTGDDFDPLKCTYRYAQYRELDPDLFLHNERGLQFFDPTRLHVETYANYYHHLVEIGWQRGESIDWRCHGTFITEQFVLTGASCISNLEAIPDLIRSENKQIFKIKEIFQHPNFTRKNIGTYQIDNDIALIELEDKAMFGENIRPACLWPMDEIPDIEVEFVGKGPTIAHEFFIEDTFNYTVGPLYARASRIPKSSCNELYRGDNLQITENQLCYGNSVYILPNSCEVLSSSPVNRNYYGTDYGFHQFQFGIHIQGEDCGFGIPAVSTRVTKYIDWIDSIIFRESKGATVSQSIRTVKRSTNTTSIDKTYLPPMIPLIDEMIRFSKDDEAYDFKECASTYRNFRKPVSNKWPPVFDHDLSTSHIGILRKNSQELGYGVLITNQHVLASIVGPEFNETTSIVLGSKSADDQWTEVKVAEIKNIENTFLLLKLLVKVTISPSLVPACLWLDKNSVPFDGLTTFQLVESKGETVKNLKVVELRPYQPSTCKDFFKDDLEVRDMITDKTSCAKHKVKGFFTPDVNLCDLWNGLPVQAIRNETGIVVPYLVGIENFIAHCGPNSTLLFNRIAHVIDSIARNL